MMNCACVQTYTGDSITSSQATVFNILFNDDCTCVQTYTGDSITSSQVTVFNILFNDELRLCSDLHR